VVGMRNICKMLVSKLKERKNLGNLGVGGKIILELIINNVSECAVDLLGQKKTSGGLL
jgi:hypothetical protein